MASNQWDAFGRFYRENLPALRGYVARLLQGSAEADDIASEAFTRVFAASSEDRPVPPKAYLFSAAHNLAMNHHRRLKVRGIVQPVEEAQDALADDSPDAEQALIARQRLNLLWEAIEQLSPRTREVFVMRKIERLRNPEIAERLGISVSAVEKHILKGLRACRAYLDEREGYGAPEDEFSVGEEGVSHG